MNNLAIVWFRQDLRLSDNPALSYACQHARQVLPIFIWDPESEGHWPAGAASRWWLHHSLDRLGAQLSEMGSQLYLVSGDSESILKSLCKAFNADLVLWNRRYEPLIRDRDKRIKTALTNDGVRAKSCNGSLWHEPWEIQTGKGLPFKVFTPMWRALLKNWNVELPLAAPNAAPVPESAAKHSMFNDLDALGLLPERDWANDWLSHWPVGEQGAQQQLAQFLEHSGSAYQERRDYPAETSTSRLSPHLHFGEISPRHIVAACADNGLPPEDKGVLGFLREVAWREFGYHLMYHWPNSTDEAWSERFQHFPWRSDDYQNDLRRWQRGNTGIPMVDAGMRELWHSGWMHNRVRMIVASFLTKNLLIPWQEGARWFWDTLVDADLANNSAGWQWTAGSGADASPYFRVFNPVIQGQKFDADGEYIQRWIPELAKVPAKWIHCPWDAPNEVLRAAGVELGHDYPWPMVDLKGSRQRALAAYERVKGK